MVKYIDDILNLEWKMFDGVKNIGGRASCQNDHKTFQIMRKSQFEAWDTNTIESYYSDLCEAQKQGRNLLSEKYGYMMRSSSPSEYVKIKHLLPQVSPEKEKLIEMVVSIELEWTEKLSEMYPLMSKQGRPIHTKEDSIYGVSIETYMRGELKTYSINTLKYLLCHLFNLKEQEKNISLMVLENMVKKYGYSSVRSAEEAMKNKVNHIN